ncbi:Transglutaminase-like superfamily protein [Pseudobythopirellula maris]|uniref:Transglutaminase-like superfamily protein n=1 Tax=Pseudobythopirellula maris TaxID=2527991 RepID=A0A5C5ZTL3_9BACT|nr:transglutaminase family protein [Pseudobythopirellula maris]TWT90580.1 Transglutaminase-like superfamily protein [Pseudobythopirellula maris]
MSILVALHHETKYNYERRITLGPQTVRLRPAPHCRTPIKSYSLSIEPEDKFLNWQQDPHGNFLARLVFHEPTDVFRVSVDLVAEMKTINPFEFFVEEYADHFPFAYEEELADDLRPFLRTLPETPAFEEYLAHINRDPRKTIDFLVDLNRQLEQDISYTIRLEPGVQTPEETLTKRSGSCRDSAWLLVQLLRRLGIAARFVSGYLIQLAPDEKPLDGPAGPSADFTDLHAWTEAYLPGAGWVGLDPTSGLLAGEGHLPLAATPAPQTAAPISGCVEDCEVEFGFEMCIKRVHEDPRVTKPYTDEQWKAIDRQGAEVDRRMAQGDVRMTMGGEPTFVSIDDMEGEEWNSAAVGPVKQKLSDQLVRRLKNRYAPGGLLHFGQGKWYPGESLPRWAFSCLWRTDGEPIWSNPDLLADISTKGESALPEASALLSGLCERLEVEDYWVRPAYEDPLHLVAIEQQAPINVDVSEFDLEAPEERRRLANAIQRGLTRPVSYVLPLTKAWWQAKPRWTSGPWPVRSERLVLIPGDSPAGLRLSLDSLPKVGKNDLGNVFPVDPFLPRFRLPGHEHMLAAARQRREEFAATITQQTRDPAAQRFEAPHEPDDAPFTPLDTIRTALCIEPRNGQLHVFMPPTNSLEDYLELVAAIEDTAEDLQTPVVIEGYLPPHDHRVQTIKVTPDPGVIEVNVQPAANWEELKTVVGGVYEDARQTRLGTEKFQIDGRHSGTGGGNHLVIGGPTPADSPFVRRPDLLRSLIGFWNNHPSLSYLFSSLFIGPTSQAPRVDESRGDAMYELDLAFSQVPEPDESDSVPPWMVDRLFRHLLTDTTGNTHRAEICIDKMFSPDSSTGRLGLVELRAFEMPPHPRMSLVQQLLVRSLITMFWERPYREKPIRWGTAIHDRFMLPHYLRKDFRAILRELGSAGLPMDEAWFEPHFEFRCPFIGQFEREGIEVELRTAIEPWYVLGEEQGGGGTTRFVDSSVERLQVKVDGLVGDRFVLACNGNLLPLTPTDVHGQWVCGVRYRSWLPPSCLQPMLPVNTPLTIDLVDQNNGRSLGGAQYFVDHPGGVNSNSYPINALEAESRRSARFWDMGHTGGSMCPNSVIPDPDFPVTLDLRRCNAW